VVRALGEADVGESAVRAPDRVGHAGQFERQEHVLARREVGQQLERLEHEADAAAAQERELVLVEVRELLPRQQNAAGSGSVEPREEPEQRRLPAARRADDGHQLAVLDLEVDRVEDDEVAPSGRQGLGEGARDDLTGREFDGHGVGFHRIGGRTGGGTGARCGAGAA
jgi:hypothetical protein